MAKFFKEGEHWVCQDSGEQSERIIPSTNYVLKYKGTIVSIYGTNTSTNTRLKNVEVTAISKDRIGGFYIDIADFITTNEDFFIA